MMHIMRPAKLTWLTLAVITAMGFSACVVGGQATQNGATPSQVPVTPASGQAIVIVDVATLRSGPGVTFEPAGTLAQGEVVTLVGASPTQDWYLVAIPEPQGGTRTAWISAEFVAPVTPTPSPAYTGTPTPEAVAFVQLLPTEGGPGTLVTVSGGGWRPADLVFVGLDDPSDGLASHVDPTAVVVAATVTDRGDFIASFVFPPDTHWAGLPDVAVIVQSSATGATASAVFHISRLATTQTPTPCGPPSNWSSYVVQPGDTLESLSRATGASIQELMAANCLSDDRIFTGQRLFVPRLPVASPTVTLVTPNTPIHTPTATPSATLLTPTPPTPTPTATPAATLLTPTPPTPTPTATPTPTPTPTPTATPAATLLTPTPPTPTPSATLVPPNTPTPTPSATLVPPNTPTPTMPPSTEVPPITPSGTP